MNRIVSKGYTGTANTPGVNYAYDKTAAGTTADFVGRLASVGTTDGFRTDIDQYDAMGRVVGSSQQIPGDLARRFLYTYNTGGGLETETYPTERQVRTCYDGAGRVASVAGKAKGESAFKPYAGAIRYAAHGPAESITLGGGVITETAVYDPLRVGCRASDYRVGSWFQTQKAADPPKRIHRPFGMTENYDFAASSPPAAPS